MPTDSSDPVTPDGDNAPGAPPGPTPTDEDYARVLFTTDTPPAATSPIAKVFATIPTATQRQHAQQFFHLIQQKDNPTKLNEKSYLTAILVLPESSTVRVLYGWGYSCGTITSSSPLDDKFLALSGEGDEEVGPPELHVLPSTLTTAKDLLHPSDTTIKEALTTKGANYGKHLLAPRAVPAASKKATYLIAPLPAYFIYDGFEQDLDAALVYERLLEADDAAPMIKNAQQLLRAALVGPLRVNDTKPYLSLQDWATTLPLAAKKWRKDRVIMLFPSLFSKTPPQPSTTDPQSSSLILNLLKQLQQERDSKTSSPTSTATESLESTATKTSTHERSLLKVLCGYEATVADSSLPTWHQQLFRPHQDDKDKDQIVADLLNSPGRFDEVELPVYPELKKMVLKRNWVGGEAGGNPKFAYACYGVSPFAMLDLSEDQIAEMEFTSQYLHESSYTTPSDIRSSKTKLVASVPMDGFEWLKILTRFTNLLFLLFGPICPLYIKILDLVKALRRYPIDIINTLPLQPKAAILWIIHLQARHFAQGKMIGPDLQACLPAFTLMYNQVCASALHMVAIAGLPARLLPSTATKPPPATQQPPPTIDKPPPKRLKPNDREPPKQEKPWNAKLKAALSGPMERAGNPRLFQIMKFCGIPKGDPVIPNTAPEDCRHYLIWGKCHHGTSCKWNHGTATNAQADTVIRKFEKFINKPEDLKGEKK